MPTGDSWQGLCHRPPWVDWKSGQWSKDMSMTVDWGGCCSLAWIRERQRKGRTPELVRTEMTDISSPCYPSLRG